MFTVGASGTAPLLYQWQKNNSDIGGATSASYTTPPVATGDNNATFRCVVRNNYGTATSNAATLTVTSGGGGGGTNVLANGSFESGTGGWTFYTNGSGAFATAAPGTNGAVAGRVSVAAAGTNVQLYQSGFPLEAGAQYTLSFDAYATAARTISVTVQKHGAPYTSYGLSARPFALGTSWQSFSVTFTAGGFSGVVSDPRLMLWLADVDVAGDQFFFDNVVLSKGGGGGGGGGTPSNALANGSFESGTTGWTFYTNGAGGIATISPGTQGASAARVSIATAGSNVQLYQYGFTLEPGTAYVLRFDAYASAPRTISVTLQKHGAPYTHYGLSARPFALGTSWQSYSASFTTSGFSGVVTDPRLMVWLADVDAPGDQYTFDNVVLSKAASASPEVLAVHQPGTDQPMSQGLSDVYPNPFNPSTNIRYTLREPSVVTLTVYSVLGQEVATLFSGPQGAGVHSVVWDGRNSNGTPMGSGVYICRMTGAGERGEPIVSVKRMLLLK
jgi:hypothetical protein